jgi:hypothetical protein
VSAEHLCSRRNTVTHLSLAILLAVLLLIPGGASATSTTYTVALTPNPVVAVEPYAVTVCGYDPGVWATVIVGGALGNDYVVFEAGPADQGGCFAATAVAGGPGDYYVSAYRRRDGHTARQNRYDLVARLEFTAVARATGG